MSERESDRAGFASRLLQGEPPVAEPLDRYVRYGFFVAWLLGALGIVGNIEGLLAPAGLLLISIGLLIFTNFRGVRDRMRQREERGLNYRLTESRKATRFGGALLTLIGLAWLVLGIAALSS